MAYLQINAVNKTFHHCSVLKDIQLSIEEGELICFLGPSGCGKTTLLRIIAGLEQQDSGTLIQGGKDVSHRPANKRDFGIVFQSYALFPNLTVSQNVGYGIQTSWFKRDDSQRRIDELLELMELQPHAKKFPNQLSGGQQQRVALARSIALNPGLLLLDEPLSALDAKVRGRLRSELKKLQRRLNITTIMVTHDQEEALAMADRIVVMNHGTIEQIGTPSEIYMNPISDFTADFVGESNHLLSKDGKTNLGIVRPENIEVLDAANEQSYLGTIEQLEYLGSKLRVQLTTDFFQKPVMVELPGIQVNDHRWQIGQPMHFALPVAEPVQ